MLITTLLILWAGFTVVLIGFLIYRGTLRMHEDCQIFLDQAEDQLAKEQEQLIGWIGYSPGYACLERAPPF